MKKKHSDNLKEFLKYKNCDIRNKKLIEGLENKLETF